MNERRGIRYAGEPTGAVHPLEEWAKIAIETIRDMVRKSAKPDRDLVPVIEGFLVEAYRAGVREGRSEERSKLEGVIRDHVRGALERIRFEPADCPHCTGLGCTECNKTGRRVLR